MCYPTEDERKKCYAIVERFLKTDDKIKCELYTKRILSITGSIGGNYDEETLTSIADTYINYIHADDQPGEGKNKE